MEQVGALTGLQESQIIADNPARCSRKRRSVYAVMHITQKHQGYK